MIHFRKIETIFAHQKGYQLLEFYANNALCRFESLSMFFTKLSQISETISKVVCDPKKFPNRRKRSKLIQSEDFTLNNLCLTTMKICFPCSGRLSRDSSSFLFIFLTVILEKCFIVVFSVS